MQTRVSPGEIWVYRWTDGTLTWGRCLKGLFLRHKKQLWHTSTRHLSHFIINLIPQEVVSSLGPPTYTTSTSTRDPSTSHIKIHSYAKSAPFAFTPSTRITSTTSQRQRQTPPQQ